MKKKLLDLSKSNLKIQPIKKTNETKSEIAIIGIGSAIGDRDHYQDFWDDLHKKRDFVADIPETRIPDIVEMYRLKFPNETPTNYRESAYLNQIDQFDASFFKISPQEADILPPEQRLFLENCWKAMEDGGYGGDRLKGSKTAVFVGYSESQARYEDLYIAKGKVNPTKYLSVYTSSLLASRISYMMDFHGPAVMVDTACSSGLVAMHKAIRALQNKEIDYALVGAVNLHLFPVDHGYRAEINSSDNRCHAFDNNSDGTGSGEGAIVFLLKRKDDAEKNKDNIHAVIKGSSLNQDGKSIGITAPNAEAQAEVIQAAWRNAKIDPKTITYIEAHGTGTKLGDPIEIDGIKKAFAKYTDKKQFCVISSVKTNIGHLNNCAGLAGVLKAVLALKTKLIPANINFTSENKNINFADSPVFVNPENHKWETQDKVYRCGVSSFGLSGTNAHLILENATEKISELKSDKPALICLSAITESTLQDYAKKIIKFVDEQDVNLHDLAFTLAVGRFHQSYRWSCWVNSIEHLKNQLTLFIDSKNEDKQFKYSFFRIIPFTNKQLKENEITEVQINNLSKISQTAVFEYKNSQTNGDQISELYHKGADINWLQFYRGDSVASISIPMYPFARKRHWIELDKSVIQQSSTGQKVPGKIISNKVTDLPNTTIYSFIFPTEEWMRNHILNNQPTLVGSSYVQICYDIIKLENLSDYSIVNLSILKAMSSEQEVIVKVENRPKNVKFEISGKVNDNWQVYAVGSLAKSDSRLDCDFPLLDISDFSQQSIPEFKHDRGILQVDDRWNCLRELYLSDDITISELEILPEFEKEASEYLTYPPLLDCVISSGMNEVGFIPSAIEHVVIKSRINKRNKVVSTLLSENDHEKTYEIKSFDENNSLQLYIGKMTFRRIEQKLDLFTNIEWINTSKNLIKENQLSDSYFLDNRLDENSLNQLLMNKHDNVILELPVFNCYDDKFYAYIERAFEFFKKLATELKSELRLLVTCKNLYQVNPTQSQAYMGWLPPFLHAISHENPNLNVRILDSDDSIPFANLFHEVFNSPDFITVCKDNNLKVRKLVKTELDKFEKTNLSINPDGIYVITGGLGGVGLVLANALVELGAEQIVLLSRSGKIVSNDDESTQRQYLLNQLLQSRKVSVEKCELADFDNMSECFIRIQKKGRIVGVIHSAGISGEGFIYSKEYRTFENVIKPKIHGTLNLLKTVKIDELDLFVLNSALTSYIGTAGQTDYCAANGFLDSCGNFLSLKHKNVFTLNWTAWKSVGMAARNNVAEDGFLKSISPELAVKSFIKVLQYQIPQVFIGESNFVNLDTSILPLQIDDELLIKEQQNTSKSKVKIIGKDNPSEMEIITANVWANQFGYDEIDIYANYYDLGGDSIYAINIINKIEKITDIRLTIADLFSHPTILEFAELLSGFVKKEEATNHAIIEHEDKGSDQNTEKFYPLTPAQERIFLLEKMTQGAAGYHLPEFWFIPDNFEIRKLEDAINTIIAINPILRTNYRLKNGKPVQFENTQSKFQVKVSNHNLNTESQETEKLVAAFIRPFDLENDIMIRAEVLGLNDARLLLIDAHHIAVDAYSFNLLFEDIQKLLSGYKLSKKSLNYMQFAGDFSQKLSDSKLKESKKYWKKHLEVIPKLDLPTDYPYSVETGYAGSSYSLEFSPSEHKQILDFAKACGTTNYNIFLSSFYWWLSGITRQNEVVIGNTVLGRNDAELMDIYGMFVNTLPIKQRINSSQSVSIFVQETAKLASEALKYDDLPFEEIINELELERDVTRNPIYDISFSYLNFKKSNEMKQQELFEPYHVKQGLTSELDIMIYGSEFADKFSFNFKFRRNLWEEKTIKIWLDRWKTLLLKAIKNPNQTIAELNKLTETEITLLNHAQGKECHFEPGSIVDIFAETSYENSDKIAVISNDKSLTYNELNNLSDRLAKNLLKYVHPNTGIAFMLERNELLPAIMLGILKSGCYYIGLDSQYPLDRISYILDDSQAKIMITDSKSIKNERFDVSDQVNVLTIDDLLVNNENQLLPPVDPDAIAYLIYTSGSTGNPKGVMISHRNLSHFVNWSHDEFEHDNFKTMLGVTSYCFDIFTFELFYPLTSGKTVRILPNALDIANWSHEEEIFISTVPSVVKTLQSINFDWQNVNSLNMAGEQIPLSIIEELDLSKLKVRNLYGPSEYTTYTTTYTFDETSNSKLRVKIGKPIANTNFKILDSKLNDVPIGAIGELYLSGKGLTCGYFDKPELNKKKFIVIENTKYYQTGDLVRLDSGLNLIFHGRTDFQTKIRGHRIELEEIEYRLNQISEIQSAVTDFDQNGEKILGACIVGEKHSQDEIILQLAQTLPPYMIPEKFIFINDLPLTPNGKVDRLSLRQLLQNAVDQDQSNEPELSHLESQLAEIWESIDGLSYPGKYDNFFKIGGNSLKALQLSYKISEALKINLKSDKIFSAPTISDLATLISCTESEYDYIQRINISEVLKPQLVTEQQKQLYLIWRNNPYSAAYNIPLVLDVPEAINIFAVERAIKALIEENSVLRSRYFESDGEIYQQICAPQVDFKYIQTTNHENCIKSELNTSFDLSKPIMLRTRVIQNLNRFYLTLVFHHIAIDEWSLNVILNKLQDFYKQYCDQRTISLNPDIQFVDYAKWINNKKHFDTNYWQDQLSGEIPKLRLSTDSIRPPIKKFEGRTISRTFSSDFAEATKRLVSKYESSEYRLLLLAYFIFLSKETSQESIITGIPISCRENSQLKNMIGFMLNTLPLKMNLHQSNSITELVKMINLSMDKLSLNANQSIRKLIEYFKPDTDLSRNPFFDTIFVLQSDNDTPISQFSDWRLQQSETMTSKFDLSFFVKKSSSTWSCKVEFDSNIYNEQRVSNQVKRFEEIVIQMSKVNKLFEIEPYSEIDRIRLKELNIKNNANYPTLQEMVNTGLNSKTGFVYDRQGCYDFQSLRDFSQSVANWLMDNDYKGKVVGVVTNRNRYSMGYFAGILLAGATYLPIVGTLPEDRIKFMLNDSNCDLILSDRNSLDFHHNCKLLQYDTFETYRNNFYLIKNDQDKPAYIIYTSGTTGTPKGVLGTNRCLANLMNWQINNSNDIESLLQFAGHGFDVSVQEMLFSLVSGASIYFVSEEEKRDPKFLVNLVIKNKVNLVTLPNSALQLFIEECIDKEIPTELRQIITSGEALQLSDNLRTFMLNNKKIVLQNQYGPSESHVVTMKSYQGNIETENLYSNIGNPIDNTKILILNSMLKEVAPGNIGEICIAGDNLACGYLNKPEQTADRFITIKYNDENLTIYRTGDLGRMSSVNEIEFIGRLDDQIKIRGYRIELKEIESIFSQSDLCSQSVAMVKGADSNKHLVLFYKSGSTPTTEEDLKTFAQKKFPNYMVPDQFIEVERFELTRNGKVDKRFLMKLIPKLDKVMIDYADLNRFQTAVIDASRDVLNDHSITLEDNFFAYGGNSINAVKFVAKLRKILGIELPMNMIWEKPQLNELAATINLLDLRKETTMTEFVEFNKDNEEFIFCMPPGIGYAFGFEEFSKIWHDKHVVAFNFPENKNPAELLAKKICEFQPTGKIMMFGYSAGGNMAYDVAVELTNLGRVIDKLIFLDVYRQMSDLKWDEQRYQKDAEKYIRMNHAEFLEDELKDSVMKKVIAYRRYLNKRSETHKVDFPIVQLMATDLITEIENISRENWSQLTNDYRVKQGFGDHMSMFMKPLLQQNMSLIKEMLEKE
jgi:amino acid adenylation domain-containing protein